MRKKTIKMERRAFDWLMNYCDMSLGDAEEHYKRIDTVMPKIKVGDKLYLFKCSIHDFDREMLSYYEVDLLEILDNNEGIVLIKGAGHYSNLLGSIEREENINHLYTSDEISKYKVNLIKSL
ncbi:MAG: hypothetical protein WC375_10235 [Methanomassiliicoccales archaeon]|jgi:hypothetical protein